MRTSLIAMVMLLAGGAVLAKGGSHSVKGHVTKDGTYVAPHQQTNPNATKADNWSSKPNVNPYTGKAGTVDPLKPAAPRR
jgi:hypothetical protein